jgi:general secretion pathway protein G
MVAGRWRDRFRAARLYLIAVLLSSALASCNPSIHRSQETVLRRSQETILKKNLYTLRTAIGQYTFDKGKAPRTLQDLVSTGYLRQVPADPITGSADTWKQSVEDQSNTVNPVQPGIFDVRSGSELTSLEGTQYSEW